MITISFVILTWNSELHLERCFDSIAKKCADEEISYEAVVIDNGSVDGSRAILKRYQEKYPEHFNLIMLDRNRGTTYPRNLGLKQARGKYICILDSDTEFCGGELSDVFHLLTTNENVGMVAPKLILPDGSVQNSVKRFPTMWHKVVKIPRILFGIATRNGDFYPELPVERERPVDSAISACWIFRSDLLDRVGYLDEKIFYSPEDLDYSHRVRKGGYSILYYTAFTVLHHTQQITHKKPFSRTSFSHFLGLLYYYQKHGGWMLRPRFKG
jgi:GT2 family glycosyltransferase